MWRQRYITTRRHPFAFGVYTLTLMLGILFATHSLGVIPFDNVRRLWQMLWTWEMISGGAVGVFALVVPVKPYPNWPDLADCLRFEGIAAIVSAFGLVTYAFAVTETFDALGAGALLIGTLGVVCGYRAWQAIRDSAYTERLAALADALQDTPLVPTEGNESYEEAVDKIATGDEVAGVKGHLEAPGENAAVHRFEHIDGHIEVVHKIEGEDD